uniref:Uncharacterized protein n=1 Tax=Anopheles atroparvus TaxID=41427 RepID=A0AAG5CYK8_ANOAO
MGEHRTVYLSILFLLFLSFKCISAQSEEYEYYYEEDTLPPSSAVSATEVVDESTMTIFQETSSMIPPTDEPIMTSSVDDESTLEKEETGLNITMVPISITATNSATQMPPRMHGSSGGRRTAKPYIRRTNQEKSLKMPEIVLNIYYGMYGMQNNGNKRGGGSNRSWSSPQNPLQGWYGLDNTGSNRRRSQSWSSNPRIPAYRGRGRMNEYDVYSGPVSSGNRGQRNPKQGRENPLDSLGQFNIWRQILGLLDQSSSRSPAQANRRRM